MWKFPSFRSVVRQSLRSLGYQPVPTLGIGALKENIPGMVSPAEMAFFSESAARSIGRAGAIVDLGCWMGSTSVSLAQGIQGRGPHSDDRNAKVLGFDRFVWEEWMPAHLPYGIYYPGESFLPEARRVARDYGGGLVELVPADLSLYEWSGGPIKILLVDAMKSESVARQIACTFYPSLLMGGLLIHQDFKHYYTSWIHVLQYRLREYFRLDASVPKSGTVAFEVLAPIPGEAVDRAANFTQIADDEVDASFQHSLELVESGENVNVAAAHVMQYLHLRRKDRALETLETYRSRGLSDKGEFPKLRDYLDQMA
jgi:hypothetical protein